jgi:hypothetical protein
MQKDGNEKELLCCVRLVVLVALKLAAGKRKDPLAVQEDSLAKTYNSGDSLVVTHLTTNPPVSCLNRAERTGSLVLKILWSYVKKWQRYSVLVVDLWCDGSAISRTRGYAPCSMHTLLPGI